jgi:hypothetical protein
VALGLGGIGGFPELRELEVRLGGAARIEHQHAFDRPSMAARSSQVQGDIRASARALLRRDEEGIQRGGALARWLVTSAQRCFRADRAR